MAIETLTFGCRLNAYESEVMKAEAEKAGLSAALIVNTCAVTEEAVRQAKQAIRKQHRSMHSVRCRNFAKFIGDQFMCSCDVRAFRNTMHRISLRDFLPL